MDIFLLFVFNIFTGAVIFLILSLKIEKTSATFQEKKLRREMGEIITEFNSTAERNITLLENRISVLRKLLNETGSVKGIDFTVLDDKMRNNSKHDKNLSIAEKSSNEKKSDHNRKKDLIDNISRLQEDQHKIIGSFIDKIQSFSTGEDAGAVKEKTKTKSRKDPVYKNMDESEDKYGSFSIIEKDVKDINKKSSMIDVSADEEIVLTYESRETVDIEELFQNADDKYTLIARLFNEGHSIEDISKYSGLPAGEIKLVISLNS